MNMEDFLCQLCGFVACFITLHYLARCLVGRPIGH